jgi:thioredoxin-like negative regulator of GroEL
MEAERTMSEAPRLAKLKEMAARFPDDPRARYFLAHELFRVEEWANAAEQYEAYVQLAPGDEGAALKNLGLCHERLGRNDLAAGAYRRGIERALAHGHEGLASEIRFLLGELDG